MYINLQNCQCLPLIFSWTFHHLWQVDFIFWTAFYVVVTQSYPCKKWSYMYIHLSLQVVSSECTDFVDFCILHIHQMWLSIKFTIHIFPDLSEGLRSSEWANSLPTSLSFQDQSSLSNTHCTINMYFFQKC